MGRATISAAILALVASGCAPDALDSTPDTPSPELTAEQARVALIELIRSPEPGELKDFPLEQFVGDGVEDKGGAPSWGPFSLHLQVQEYSYTRTFGQPPRVCRWQYRGGFELRAGRWVALPPRIESHAIAPE